MDIPYNSYINIENQHAKYPKKAYNKCCHQITFFFEIAAAPKDLPAFFGRSWCCS